MRAALPTPWLLAALTAAYFGAGKIGLSFASLNSSASAVWPPTGIAIAALLLFGTRAWPAIFAGAFLVNVTTAGTLATSVSIAAGNTLEGLAAAWLVNRFAGGRACFDHGRDVFRFAGLAALATTLSATIGVASLALAGLAPWPDVPAIWLTWWLGDAAGAVLVAPLMMLWHEPQPLPAASRGADVLVTMLLVLAAAVVCFTAPVLRDYPLVFLCLPPLAWIAFRFGPRETATANVLLATVAVVATGAGFGPFVMATRNESLLVLQAFMGMVAVTLMPMAALVREHREAVRRAEEATHARDVFLAMLSHELRNPLQAISTSLHLLGRDGATPVEATRAVAIASRQSEHLARLVNDLLDVSRAVSGKIDLERRPVCLDEIARHCVQALEGSERLGARKLLVDASPVIVDADAGRVEQVIANLLGNALKFTANHGTIRLTVREEGGEGVLRVQDDGIGITPELLPRVFDLFTQGERTLERREGGLGIGLTLVRTLAELHGGSAEARSAGAGKGSELIVRLPLSVDEVAPAPKPALATARAMRRRILIIEDNADAREALQAVLAADGHDVYEAADGEAGIEAAQRTRPDVVLVDIGLPRVDGYEVARRLRSMEAGLGVKWRLIALSGYGQAEDVRHAFDAGFHAHLVKPVMPERLGEVLAVP